MQDDQQLYVFGPDQVPEGLSALIMGIHRLSRRLSNEITKIVKREANVSLMTWRTLMMLSLMYSASQKEIVELCGSKQALISRVLKDAVKAGEVSVKNDPDDSRRRLFAMTEKGRKIHESILPSVASFVKAVDSALSPKELQQFLEMCQRIYDIAQNAGKTSHSRSELKGNNFNDNN